MTITCTIPDEDLATFVQPASHWQLWATFYEVQQGPLLGAAACLTWRRNRSELLANLGRDRIVVGPIR
jgi:hypothetical protein